MQLNEDEEKKKKKRKRTEFIERFALHIYIFNCFY